jgi:uncharacterized repeat protein (TIGR01451 family)
MKTGVGKTLKTMIVAFALLAAGIAFAEHTPQPKGASANTGPGSLAGGYGFSCALTSSGAVKCWGRNSLGALGNGSYTHSFVPVQVQGIHNATALAGRLRHVCALLATGAVRCWGHGSSGQLGSGPATFISNTPVNVVGIADAIAITAGDDHSCALLAAGTVKCWGNNTYYQLGNGVQTNSSVPVDVAGISNGIAIAAGGAHTCALAADGTVSCWGSNSNGQLGSGNSTVTTTPVLVPALSGVADITSGNGHSCARLSAGGIRCWGDNYFGQLGNGANTSLSAPVPVTGISDASAVSAGGVSTCAVLGSGAMRCWGNNGWGQLGNGGNSDANVPMPVTGISNPTAVMGTYSHFCARFADALRCWGYNIDGEMGNGVRGVSEVPVDMPNVIDADAISVNGLYTCALVGGTVRCSGANHNGQLGNGQAGYSLVPVPVTGISNATAITTAYWHACAIVSGSVYCWGLNSSGQLGNGTTTSSSVPVAVTGLNNAIAVAASHFGVCALTSVGEVKCWGGNYSGQLGNGGPLSISTTPVTASGISTAVALAAGNFHNCAVLAGGDARCWGSNTAGQLGDGSTTNRITPVNVSGISGVTALTGGELHTCAVLATGEARCWGDNSNGQLGTGSTVSSTTPVAVVGLTGVSMLEAGWYHTCGIASGILKCWGSSSNGQLGNGNTNTQMTPENVLGISNVIAVTAGSGHSCAAIADAPARCWGSNFYGAFGNGERGFEPLATPVPGSPFITYNLSYSAGANGSISGPQQQVVDSGANGSAVTAVPASGYLFTQWSDGVTANPRSDSNVQAHMAVTAAFANAAPAITATSVVPASPYEKESATISVSATDSSPGALAYSFDCDGNGSFEIGPQAASSTSCLFQTPGTYSVGVRVADVPGASSTSSLDVIVRNSVPVVTLNPNAQPLEDSVIPLIATATSPSSGEQVILVEADCDYDGSTFDTNVSAASASGLTCPSFPAPGTHIIALRARDNENETSSIVTATVDVVGVNDAPGLSVASLIDHPLGSSGAQSIFGFAVFDAGPADEDLTQSVQDYVVDSIADPAGILVAGTLDIANDGRLGYTLSGIGGIATVQVHVLDNGGTANGGVNASPMQQFQISVPASADLQVSKNNQRNALIDGETTVYAIVIANAGPNPVAGATISDTLPPTLINGSWICVPAQSSASCPTPNAGSGNLNAVVNLGVNQFLRFDVMAEVDGSVGAFVINTASASLPAGITELNTGNNSATDQDAIVALGIFANGFEAVAMPPTVPGATEAMRD